MRTFLWEKFDDEKYAAQARSEFEQKPQQADIRLVPDKRETDHAKLLAAIEQLRTELQPQVFETVLKIYGFTRLGDIQTDFEKTIFYRSLRSYTNKDTVAFMVSMIIDSLSKETDPEFYAQILETKGGVNSKEKLMELDRESIAIIYRSLLYKSPQTKR
jgi:hypothetical protein